jgi:hypothetical protein
MSSAALQEQVEQSSVLSEFINWANIFYHGQMILRGIEDLLVCQHCHGRFAFRFAGENGKIIPAAENIAEDGSLWIVALGFEKDTDEFILVDETDKLPYLRYGHGRLHILSVDSDRWGLLD